MKKIVVVIAILLLLMVNTARADGIICKGGGVFAGSTKVEVLYKCGPPLLIQREEWALSVNEIWSYVIDGCFRYFYFEGNILRSIKDGSLAK